MPHAFLATVVDLNRLGVQEKFTDSFSSEVIDANCQAVTDECLGRMGPAVTPPLLSWGSDIRANASRILAYELKSIKGLAPTNVAVGDENLLVRATQAREWFDAVGRGEIKPQDLEDSGGLSTSPESTRFAGWSSKPLRGWSY